MMKYRGTILSLVLMLALAATGYSGDQEKTAADKPPPETKLKKTDANATLTDKEVVARRPVYKPPRRGAPAGRVGGGTRGVTERESFSLLVLAPDHLGYTVNQRPCLYWYISKPTTYPVEVTLTERRAIKPLLEKVIDGPTTGGIQQVCLEDYDVQLRDDVPYKWFVSLVTDAAKRSKDILAGGMVAKLPGSAELSDRLNRGEQRQKYFIYAEQGLWYDAVDEVVRKLNASPQDSALRQHLVALLEQVGLGEIVAGAAGQSF